MVVQTDGEGLNFAASVEDVKADMVGTFRKGEDEPYKWEKIKN